MAPKNKKPGRNGFFQFMKEIKEERGLSMLEAQQVAGDMWKRMSMEEREPYRQEALHERSHFDNTRKYTTVGIPIDEFQNEQEQKSKEELEMKEDINNRLKFLKEANAIHTKPFLIIQMTKLVEHEREGVFYICEMAIAAFTLQNGLTEENIFYKVVKPGRLPLGLYGDAVTLSKITHGMIDIALEGEQNNTHEVFTEMVKFLRRFEQGRELPILYAQEKAIPMIKNVLNVWMEMFDYPLNLKVYSYEYMFFVLKNTVGNNIWSTDTIAYKEIDKDSYSHVSKLACEFHEGLDNTLHCSKSVVTRFAYYVCDFCCGHLGIELIPGRHAPPTAQTVAIPSRSSSRASSVVSSCASSNIASSDDDYSSDFPSLGSRSASYKTASSTDISSRKSYAASVERGTATDSDINSVSNRLKNVKVKLPKKKT